jgi:hypothetical protein
MMSEAEQLMNPFSISGMVTSCCPTRRATQLYYWMQLAWAMLGFTEQLELLHGMASSVPGISVSLINGSCHARGQAHVTLPENTRRTDTILDRGTWCRLGSYLDRPADPFNDEEPVTAHCHHCGTRSLFGQLPLLKGR